MCANLCAYFAGHVMMQFFRAPVSSVSSSKFATSAHSTSLHAHVTGPINNCVCASRLCGTRRVGGFGVCVCGYLAARTRHETVVVVLRQFILHKFHINRVRRPRHTHTHTRNFLAKCIAPCCFAAEYGAHAKLANVCVCVLKRSASAAMFYFSDNKTFYR